MTEPVRAVSRSSSKRVFLSETGRLRAGWRILGFLVFFVILSAVATLLLRATVGRLPEDRVLANALRGTLAVVLATAAVYVARRFLDRKSFSSLGLQLDRHTGRDIVLGFLLSGLLVAVIFFLELSFNWVQLQGTGFQDNSGQPLLRLCLSLIGTALTVAWWEEVVFRGYVLQNLTDGVGLAWAVGLSCLLYGVIHLLNPHASIFSTLAIAAIGYLRIYCWLRTEQLWLSMGMHAGWNFCQGSIFGFPVSGQQTFSVLKQKAVGPTWATGGLFGPEASFLAFLAVAMGLGCVFLWTRSRQAVLQR